MSNILLGSEAINTYAITNGDRNSKGRRLVQLVDVVVENEIWPKFFQLQLLSSLPLKSSDELCCHLTIIKK